MLENFLLYVFAIVIVGYVYGKIFGIVDLIECANKDSVKKIACTNLFIVILPFDFICRSTPSKRFKRNFLFNANN